MTADEHDARSVGELLRDADIISRQLLFDAGVEDGPGMLRTWAEVVEAAAGVWRQLPSYPLGDDREAMAMTRLETLSREMHRIVVKEGWLGAGPGDESLTRMRDAYASAEDLIVRVGRHIGRGGTEPGDLPAVQADVAAARARIMHGLYVASHGVAVAARAHLETLPQPGPKVSPTASRGVPRGRETLDRLAVIEHLAGSYVARRTSAAYDGEHVRPLHVLERLEHAIARWDIQAHRALARSPTPANLTLTARVQADAAAATAHVIDAGLRLGAFDIPTTHARRSPALEDTAAAWHRAARRWAQLSPPGRLADADLVLTAGELRAVTREICHDRTGWASPELIAHRVSPTGAAQALQESLATGVDLAYAASAIASTAPLHAPAKTVVGLCSVLADPGDTRPNTGARSAFLSGVQPGDVHANRDVPLPPALRQTLTADMESLVQESLDAASATAWLDQPAADTVRDPTALMRSSHPRGIQERLPMDYSPAAYLAPGNPGR